MLKKFINKLKELTNAGDTFDPAIFGDSVAEQTDWTPAKKGGTNFRTHELIRVGPLRFEFRASIVAKLFYSLFLLAGIGLIIGLSVSGFSSGAFLFDVDTIMPLSIGFVFVIIGGCMLYFGTAPNTLSKGPHFIHHIDPVILEISRIELYYYGLYTFYQ